MSMISFVNKSTLSNAGKPYISATRIDFHLEIDVQSHYDDGQYIGYATLI